MKILFIGSGYVGACSAAVSADSGHEVLVYDIDPQKIAKFNSMDKDIIEEVLYENGLGEMIIRNRERISFSHDLAEVGRFLDQTEAVFMCLPTPEKDGSGETNLTYYLDAARGLAALLAKRNNGSQGQYILIINKSTVPIETVGITKEIMQLAGVENFGVGSNPEFLVEGKAIQGSIKPERIVVGAESSKDFAVFRDIYKRFINSPNVNYIEVNPYEAAAGKLLANFVLFNRLAVCFDVVGRACEKFENLDFEKVRSILINDKRIGEWGFYNSLYAGGSCFIKDARSLMHQLGGKNAGTDLIEDTLEGNKRQLENFLMRSISEKQFDFTGKTAGLFGLAFKRNTNDVRNSAALGATEFMLNMGAKEIRAFDPIAGPNYLNYFNEHKDADKIKLAAREEESLAGCDVILIACDWPEFRELTPKIIENFPPGGLIMDGRRMLAHDYNELAENGYDIIAVGSPLIKRKE